MPSMEEVMVAARRKLLADAGFSALVGTDVGVDATGAYTDAWVFKATDAYMAPQRNPRNTGKSSIVYAMPAPWTQPNRDNSLKFRELHFRVLSDNTRSVDKDLLYVDDADYRCDRVSSAIIKVFNDVSNRDHNWPNGVYIVSSVLWNDLRIDYVNKEDGLVSGDFSFALELG